MMDKAWATLASLRYGIVGSSMSSYPSVATSLSTALLQSEVISGGASSNQGRYIPIRLIEGGESDVSGARGSGNPDEDGSWGSGSDITLYTSARSSKDEAIGPITPFC